MKKWLMASLAFVVSIVVTSGMLGLATSGMTDPNLRTIVLMVSGALSGWFFCAPVTRLVLKYYEDKENDW